jgi:hypothetical protein
MERTVIAVIMAVVLTACSQTAPAPRSSPSTASVNGFVFSAPGCPVERADSPCPPMPVRDADVVAALDGVAVAHTRSATDGSFELALLGGSYTLTATTSGGYHQTASQAVLVPDTGVTTVTITLDSGIR